MGKFYYDNEDRGIYQGGLAKFQRFRPLLTRIMIPDPKLKSHGRLYDKDNEMVYYTDGACFNNGHGWYFIFYYTDFAYFATVKRCDNAVSGCGVYGGPGMRLSFANPDNVLKTKVFVALTDILGLRSMQHQQFCRVARDQGWSWMAPWKHCQQRQCRHRNR